jgi:ABC-type transport system involved in cytochrome bd biosynthesis fused ATPase/permease subunit
MSLQDAELLDGSLRANLLADYAEVDDASADGAQVSVQLSSLTSGPG